MAAVSQTSIKEISCQLATLCIEIGEHQAVFPSLCKQIEDEKKSLSDIGEEKIKAIIQRLGQFAVTESNFKNLKSRVEAAADRQPETVRVWKDQLECIQEPLKECTRQGNYLFEGILKRVGSLYRQTLTKLEEYRRSHEPECRATFKETNNTFERWVKMLPSKPYGFVNPHMTKKSLELLEHAKFLSWILPPKGNRSPILYENQLHLSQDSLRKTWETLSPEMKKAIDEEICKAHQIATEERKNWLEDKRFYYSKEFRQAYIGALKASLLKDNPNLSKEDYCTLLHKCALGNEFSDPVEWVKQELPYLTSLFPEVDRLYASQK